MTKPRRPAARYKHSQVEDRLKRRAYRLLKLWYEDRVEHNRAAVLPVKGGARQPMSVDVPELRVRQKTDNSWKRGKYWIRRKVRQTDSLSADGQHVLEAVLIEDALTADGKETRDARVIHSRPPRGESTDPFAAGGGGTLEERIRFAELREINQIMDHMVRVGPHMHLLLEMRIAGYNFDQVSKHLKCAERSARQYYAAGMAVIVSCTVLGVYRFDDET